MDYDFTYTGAEIQAILDTGKKLKDSGYIFLGVATPSTNPGTPTQKVYYEAKQAGTYTNFGGVVLPDGISLLIWNGSWTSETVMCGDGGVFDISVYKSSGGTLATFADLSAALNGGNNIPASARKGGMSVKFVQSSDNKYVQYRLMSDTFNTTVANWQGIDDVPTAGSDNLVKSGGIEKVMLTKRPLFTEVSPTIVNDYYIKPDGTQSTQNNDGRYYASLPVTAGDVMRVSGYNLNAAFIGAFVSSPGHANQIIFNKDTSSSFSNIVAVINYSGTLYVNGNSNYGYDIKIEKQSGYDQNSEVIYQDVDDLKERMTTVESEISTLTPIVSNKLDKKDVYENITPTPKDKYYIRNDGTESLQSNDGRQYSTLTVDEGEKLVVSGYGITACNAVILKKTNAAIVSLLEAGSFIKTEITVPSAGTLYINGNINYQEVEVLKYQGKQDSQEFYSYIEGIDKKAEQKRSDLQSYYYDGSTLRIASKFQGNSNYDIVQFWQNTLQYPFNTIFSFYLVKKYANTSPVPSIDVNPNQGIEVTSQSSDCILATRFNRKADFSGSTEKDVQYAGGNHTLLYNGQHYKTAETQKVEIYADGNAIQKDILGCAKEIDILVTTNVYDPFDLYDSLEIDQSNPVYNTLFVEKALYRVIGGAIHCVVTRRFAKYANMDTYGGFASMAGTLDYGYFPMGAAMSVEEIDRFGKLDYNIGVYDGSGLCNKEEYPDFNHFIRRNADNTLFESVFLTSYDSGNHSEIPNDYSMYWAILYDSWNKVYHRVTYHKNFAINEVQRLEGIYNWFIPCINDANSISYGCGNYLIIDIKGEFTGTIEVPDIYKMKPFEVIQKTSNCISIGNFINADGVDLVCSGEASLILNVNI